MLFFFFVPTEGGQTEMAALKALDPAAAVAEAKRLEFGGRVGHLFNGDLYVQDVQTASAIRKAAPLQAASHRPSGASATYGAPAAPRPPRACIGLDAGG